MAGYTEQEFFQNFRLRRNAFHHVCQRLSPRLSRDVQEIHLLEKASGAILGGNGAGYRTLANLFGIAKSSVCATVLDFCKAVPQVLMPDCIKLSQEAHSHCRYLLSS